jgi:hypothetical protein
VYFTDKPKRGFFFMISKMNRLIFFTNGKVPTLKYITRLNNTFDSSEKKLHSKFSTHYLPKHCCLSFYSSNSPACNSQPINHSCVGISTHHTIRVENAIIVENNPSKVFQINLQLIRKISFQIYQFQSTK